MRAAVLAQIRDCGPAARRLGEVLEQQVERRQLGAATSSTRLTGRLPAVRPRQDVA